MLDAGQVFYRANRHHFPGPDAARGEYHHESELRYLLKPNSDCDACSDQESLRALLTDLRGLACDLDLDVTKAYREAGTLSELHDPFPFCPSI
jgi:hypothetical protein